MCFAARCGNNGVYGDERKCMAVYGWMGHTLQYPTVLVPHFMTGWSIAQARWESCASVANIEPSKHANIYDIGSQWMQPIIIGHPSNVDS